MSYHYSLPHPPHQLGTPPIQSENGTKVEQQEPSLPSTANPTPPPTAISAAEPVETGTSDAPAAAEIIQVDTEEKTTAHPTQPSHTVPQAQLRPVPPTSSYPGGLPIDVCFEAGKLPLDVAIFNSARACGGDDKIRKFLQAVLVIGGGAHIPGMAHALESRSVSQRSILPPFFNRSLSYRLQAIATPLVPNMEKVQIIPSPKDVDPSVLAWKGAAVLGKMDSAADLWLSPTDWVRVRRLRNGERLS